MSDYSVILTSDSFYTAEGLEFFLGLSPEALRIARRAKLLRSRRDAWGHVYRGDWVKAWLRAVDEVADEGRS